MYNTKEDVDRLVDGIEKTYEKFMREAEKYNNQSADIGRTALYPFYGNTYYYEYYFLRNTK